MHLNEYTRIVVFILLIWIVRGCIEPYDMKVKDVGMTLVIDGMLTDREGNHRITLSQSTSYNAPSFNPVSGCLVEVIDQNGSALVFGEGDPGIYERHIEQSFLVHGNEYMLRIEYNGSSYESAFQELIPAAPVGRVYWEIEERETPDPGFTLQGIQFYTDLEVPEGTARNYSWTLEETWEYHSTYHIKYFWDGYVVQPPGFVPSDLYYCWGSRVIPEIHTVTTRVLSEPAIKGLKLHYVDNQSDRLKIRYSLLIRQYGLNEEAYQYWAQIRELSQETGGLYETQPSQIRGNMVNTEDPTDLMLGFFGVCGLDEKRIYVDEQFTFFPENLNCTPYLPPWGLPKGFPKYLVEVNEVFMMANFECFDCTMHGGTTTKPEWWQP